MGNRLLSHLKQALSAQPKIRKQAALNQWLDGISPKKKRQKRGNRSMKRIESQAKNNSSETMSRKRTVKETLSSNMIATTTFY